MKEKLEVILYRHKEPELGLDCSKGFSLGIWLDGEEIASLEYSPNKEED